jgi:hypothetical protein
MHWIVYPIGAFLFLGVALAAFLREFAKPPSKKTTWQQHVAKSHGPLELIAPRLWVVRAACRPERTMVIYKLNSGGLLLHSVVALQNDEMAKLEALGEVQFIVVPNPFHRMDAHVYHLVRDHVLIGCSFFGMCPFVDLLTL